MSDGLTASEIIELLRLEPHPEGGRFAETWRAPAIGDERAAGTAIYFLLQAGESSHWHRVDAAEVWHHYAGAPLRLRVAHDGVVAEHVLGADLGAGERPQRVVGADQRQVAESLGEWALVGCTVSPGFDFAGFELAPTGWGPPGTVEPQGD
jgi:predicted cupin superfamily sugar epimerase